VHDRDDSGHNPGHQPIKRLLAVLRDNASDHVVDRNCRLSAYVARSGVAFGRGFLEANPSNSKCGARIVAAAWRLGPISSQRPIHSIGVEMRISEGSFEVKIAVFPRLTL